MTPTAETSTGETLTWSTKQLILVLIALALTTTTMTLVSCQPESVIGQAGAGGAQECPGCQQQPQAESAPGCEDADEKVRALYDAWRSTPNDLGVFAGTTWEGYIETDADITLVIEADQTAFLQLDAPPHPEVDKNRGFLCNPGDFCPTYKLYPHARYPIHGAHFDGQRLQIVLNPLSPFESWCRVQDPRPRPDDSLVACQHDLVWKAQFSEPCQADGREVDCHWLHIAYELSPCQCTSTACFTRTEWAPHLPRDYGDGFRLDLRYDPDERLLLGTMLIFAPCCPGESDRNVLLRLAEP